MLDFLQKIFQGLDLVAQLAEDRERLLEIDLIFRIIEFLKKILAQITDRTIINEYSDRLDKEELEEIDRYRILIDRTINSTIWYLDKYKQEIE